MENQSFDGAENESKSGSAKSEKAELKAALFELAQTKREVEQAREVAAKSWLESKPLFDELDRIQSELSKSKSRLSKVTGTISTIESQHAATTASIASTQEEEREERRKILEVQRRLDQMRGDVAMLQAEVAEERLAREKLKQQYGFKRQSLQTLRLRYRAARTESGSCRASAGAALRCIKHSKEIPTIELLVEEYEELITKANGQTALADRRVAISIEQRQAAEKQHERALRKFNKVHAQQNGQMRGPKVCDIFEEKDYIRNQQQLRPSTSQHNCQTQADNREKSTTNSRVPPRMRASKRSSRNMKIIKKPSVFRRIRSFLLRHIQKIFG